MKIVLDTNVLISGIFWRGLPFKILENWMNEEFQVLASAEIVDEYSRVLQIIAKRKKRSDLVDLWAMFIVQNVNLIKPRCVVKVCRDPNDDMFINCALSGEADCIVSGDNDLLSLKEEIPVDVITPKEFLNRF